MTNAQSDHGSLKDEVAVLKQRLQELEDLRDAISVGAVDALVVGPSDERKRVLMLSGAYARYRQLVERMQQGAVTVGRDGEILFANQSFSDLLGIPLTNLFRTPIHRYVEVSDRRAIEDLFSPDSRRHDLDAALVRSDGNSLRARLSLVSASNDFSTLIITDLTQGEGSREAREASAAIEAIRAGSIDALVVADEQVVLVDSMHPYREIVERMDQGAAVVSDRGEVVFVNEKLLSMLALSRADVMGRPLVDFIESQGPELAAAMGGLKEKNVRLEVGLRRSDGKVPRVTVSVTGLQDQSICLFSTALR